MRRIFSVALMATMFLVALMATPAFAKDSVGKLFKDVPDVQTIEHTVETFIRDVEPIPIPAIEHTVEKFFKDVGRVL